MKPRVNGFPFDHMTAQDARRMLRHTPALGELVEPGEEPRYGGPQYGITQLPHVALLFVTDRALYVRSRLWVRVVWSVVDHIDRGVIRRGAALHVNLGAVQVPTGLRAHVSMYVARIRVRSDGGVIQTLGPEGAREMSIDEVNGLANGVDRLLPPVVFNNITGINTLTKLLAANGGEVRKVDLADSATLERTLRVA
jgi:hypothetical protein